MKKSLIFPLVLFTALAACKEQQQPPLTERPPSAMDTMETSRLGQAVDAYVASPSDQNAATVDQAFAKIDGEIAELDKRSTETSGDAKAEASTKSSELRTYRDKELARYTAAQAKAKVSEAGTSVEKAADKAGDKIEHAADKVKDGVDHAVNEVKKAF